MQIDNANGAVDTSDDFVVSIPDDEVVDVKGAGAAQANASGEPVGKKEREPQARVSLLAKRRDGDEDTADRRAREAIERERDEARRLAQEAQARADAMEARVRQEAEARAAAEDNSRLREDQAMRAHWERLRSQKSEIETSIASQKAMAASAERDMIEATEKGDAVKLAAAQRAVAKAEAALLQLESGLSEADRQLDRTRQLFSEHDTQREAQQTQRQKDDAARRAREAEEAAQRQAKPVTPDSWIDTVARKALGDDGADWLRDNKKFATDEKSNRAFLRFADQYADDHGPEALKSPEFIEALNERFLESDGASRRSAPRKQDVEPEPEIERPRARTASAPVSRGNQFFSSRNPNATQVRLPPKLAQFVRQAGLDPTSYALGVVADIKAGKLPKNFLDPDYDHNA